MKKKPVILVVEDDEDTNQALTMIIEILGYQPLSFLHPKKALKELQNKDIDIDLALLDIMMPEMNGYQLMNELKIMPKFKNTPIIMVTAKDEDSEILEGYKEGADYYITKPFTSKQIEYGLKLFLDSNKNSQEKK